MSKYLIEIVYITLIATVIGVGFWSGVLYYIPGT